VTAMIATLFDGDKEEDRLAAVFHLSTRSVR
jgi:hypothetical protein